ncbi:dTDP-4-dehydrorhamnose 3,5-epimerase [Roseibium aquae]|uniref:dTDP-4-dehydrorhamnose 3,5-epimerase n=1 Tax=Roseibium aquae TaxID=1323746 RepID=A0A916TML8_9HYPH|nr:dTDP-4-dehydrorhamnose 3,5-epimerase [Roseibium aquae]GGB61190.1 dTDP-4-dehydrorhamnose 3,5-epimerase [Roseibium aquae]
MTEIRPLGLEGVVEIIPKKFGDERGFFSETFNAKVLKEAGIEIDFVQDNHSFSAQKGVLRGLHFQTPPFAQDKLVRVTRGAVFDVVVDIRKGSPTFAKWVGVEISAKKWNQVLVPKGFAHGFVTLEPDTEFLYKVSNYYSRDCDRSIRFDDPQIGVEWPIDSAVILSDKDRAAGLLAETETGFHCEV